MELMLQDTLYIVHTHENVCVFLNPLINIQAFFLHTSLVCLMYSHRDTPKGGFSGIRS